jgi:hypothetical protein
MRYHTAPGSIDSGLDSLPEKGINLGCRNARLRKSKQPRKAALPVPILALRFHNGLDALVRGSGRSRKSPYIQRKNLTFGIEKAS